MLEQLKQHLKSTVAAMAKEIVKRFEPLEADVEAVKADLKEVKGFIDDLKAGKFEDDTGDLSELFGRKSTGDTKGAPSEPQSGTGGGQVTTSLSALASQDDSDKPATSDPVKAGAAAAAKARIEGGDVVTEAAKAAHAEAKKGGLSDLEANKAAADAAKAEGAGDPEAARAASTAAMSF